MTSSGAPGTSNVAAFWPFFFFGPRLMPASLRFARGFLAFADAPPIAAADAPTLAAPFLLAAAAFSISFSFRFSLSSNFLHAALQ